MLSKQRNQSTDKCLLEQCLVKKRTEKGIIDRNFLNRNNQNFIGFLFIFKSLSCTRDKFSLHSAIAAYGIF